jgi:hypothetical protein
MIRFVFTVCLVAASTFALAEEAAVNISKCAMCHKDPEFFTGKTQEELVAAIKASSESPKHKFTKDLSDEQIKAMAEALLSQ